jgi:hypothetical protein
LRDEFGEIGRPMDVDTGEPAAAVPVDEHHIDLVAFGPFDPPQQRCAAMGSQRARAGGEHGGGYLLLDGLGRARQSSDSRVQLVEVARADRSMPRI